MLTLPKVHCVSDITLCVSPMLTLRATQPHNHLREDSKMIHFTDEMTVVKRVKSFAQGSTAKAGITLLATKGRSMFQNILWTSMSY